MATTTPPTQAPAPAPTPTNNTQPILTPANAARVIRRYGGVVIEPVSAPERGMILGIYGPGGVGKTTLAATITNSELGSPALYLDARGNPHVISSYADRIDVATITAFSQVEAIRQDLLKDKALPYKSVILDNVTEMWSMDMRDRYGPMAAVTWEKHAATTSDIIQLVRNWVDLALTGPRLNVVLVFQESPETRTIRGREGVSRSEVAFNKALQSHVPTLVNFLGRLYQMQDTPPYRRMLDFRPVETVHQAKRQIDPKDEVASRIPYEIWDPSLAPLLDTLRGHKPFPVERHAEKRVAGTGA